VKVLVVDDNQDILELLKSLLEMGGYDPIIIASGKEGLNLILKEKFDIVLLDITMPEFSGFDVVQSLSDSGDLSSNIIILFTAASISDNEIEKWIKLGVKGFLRKPFDPETLFATINRVVDES